jgi:hypothetical protein
MVSQKIYMGISIPQNIKFACQHQLDVRGTV